MLFPRGTIEFDSECPYVTPPPEYGMPVMMPVSNCYRKPLDVSTVLDAMFNLTMVCHCPPTQSKQLEYHEDSVLTEVPVIT